MGVNSLGSNSPIRTDCHYQCWPCLTRQLTMLTTDTKKLNLTSLAHDLKTSKNVCRTVNVPLTLNLSHNCNQSIDARWICCLSFLSSVFKYQQRNSIFWLNPIHAIIQLHQLTGDDNMRHRPSFTNTEVTKFKFTFKYSLIPNVLSNPKSTEFLNLLII